MNCNCRRKKMGKNTLSASTFTITLTQCDVDVCSVAVARATRNKLQPNEYNWSKCNGSYVTFESFAIVAVLHSVCHCHCRWLFVVSTILLDTCWNRYLFHQTSFFIFICFSFGFLFLSVFFFVQQSKQLECFWFSFQRRTENNRNKLRMKDNERQCDGEKE